MAETTCFACGEPIPENAVAEGCTCGASPLCEECWAEHNCIYKYDDAEDFGESD